MGGGDTGAAVTEPEAPQPLRQAVGEGPPAALADDGLVGAMDLQGKQQIWGKKGNLRLWRDCHHQETATLQLKCNS